MTETAQAPAAGQLVPLARLTAALISGHGWEEFYLPSPGRPSQRIPEAVQVQRARLLAEAHGVTVSDGWAGDPVITPEDADRLIAIVDQAEADQRERERRDDEATAAWRAEQQAADAGLLRASEVLGFLGPRAAATALRRGGCGLPGFLDPAVAAQAQAERGTAAGVMSSVAPPSYDEGGW